jgi:uncharacterized membrane protein
MRKKILMTRMMPCLRKMYLMMVILTFLMMEILWIIMVEVLGEGRSDKRE